MPSSRGSSPPRSPLTYLVLARAFRSLLLPLKAVLLNLLYGRCELRAAGRRLPFRRRRGRARPKSLAQIEGWIPIFLFATLFGLSMDYEVFLVSRMREAWDARHDNVEAVALGLERTGGLITAAALVMAISFAGFVVGTVPGLQQFGLGLAFAVADRCDAGACIACSSLMAIMGRWNWWLPSPPLRASRHTRLEEAP